MAANSSHSARQNAEALIQLIRSLQPTNTIAVDGSTIQSTLNGQTLTFNRTTSQAQRVSRNIR